MKFLWLLMISSIKVHINQFMPLALLEKLAERRLVRTIKNAYETVPYYKQKYDAEGIDIHSIRTTDDLKKLPFITKDEIRENFPDTIVGKNINIDDCHYSATTGSTGKSLPFIYSLKTYAFYMMTNVRVYSMIGYRPWHKAVYIKYTAVEMPTFGPFFRTAHIPSTINVEEQMEMLIKEKPDLLIGYASIIHEIALKMPDDQLKKLKVKFISVNAEVNTQAERDFISERFGCPVYDEYSTEETWMIASQCKKGKYHLFIDNIWAEFLDKDGKDVKPGQLGEIVLTTIRSDAMPFIRYKIGDLGIISNNKCSCHLGFPLIDSFEGRADDSFILPSGKYVSSLKVLNTFTKFIKNHLHLMEEFKVVQKTKDLIDIYLVKGREYNEDTFKELISALHDIFGEPVTINLEHVEKIENNGTIKRKAIESLVNRV